MVDMFFVPHQLKGSLLDLLINFRLQLVHLHHLPLVDLHRFFDIVDALVLLVLPIHYLLLKVGHFGVLQLNICWLLSALSL
jgi:hypothetical protein